MTVNSISQVKSLLQKSDYSHWLCQSVRKETGLSVPRQACEIVSTKNENRLIRGSSIRDDPQKPAIDHV